MSRLINTITHTQTCTPRATMDVRGVTPFDRIIHSTGDEGRRRGVGVGGGMGVVCVGRVMNDLLTNDTRSYNEGKNTNLRSRAVWFSLSPLMLHK